MKKLRLTAAAATILLLVGCAPSQEQQIEAAMERCIEYQVQLYTELIEPPDDVIMRAILSICETDSEMDPEKFLEDYPDPNR